VGDIADEAPFVPVNQADVAGPANDAEAVDDAANAAPVEAIPNDPDAVEDGEDFDGLMELIGMRGPLTGLVQNVIFSAVLISGTVVGGIWLPYIWGKLVLLLAAHPITLFVGFPVDCCVVIANLLTDVLLFVLGSVIHWTDQIIRASLTPLAQSLPFLGTYTHSTVITDLSRSVAERGMDRMARVIVTTSLRFFETDYPIFSVLCHQSLQRLKSLVTEELLKLPVTAKAIYAGILVMSTPSLWWMTLVSALSKFPTSKEIWRFIMWPLPVLVGTNLTAEPARAGNTTTSWMVSNASTTAFVDRSSRTTPLDLDLAYWGTGDRIIAIIAGYTLFALIGALYVRRGRPYATTEQGQRIEILLSEALRQAGGVLKVVLIISIEMIAFPLYCGLLLDLALLPLFEQTSILSRVHFSMSSPWTSAFVHWFIGTCYMFHFALFVSMCRKIMRKGVLCESSAASPLSSDPSAH
jgi:E3 ubiquitin-protein ligase MARCH6